MPHYDSMTRVNPYKTMHQKMQHATNSVTLHPWQRRHEHLENEMTSIKALENSIFWQKHVMANALNPAQKARAAAAIERLTAQLKAQLSA